MTPVISQTNFPGLKLRGRGKVRDIYEVGDKLLIVATDRLSAFDVVLPTPIPDKGKVLTQLSLFWFEKLAALVPNHIISAKNFGGELAPYAEALDGRAMLVRKTEPAPIECVVRGYISGSGWKDYQKTGAICGIKLPAGMRESDRLPEPIFTPSTKRLRDTTKTFRSIRRWRRWGGRWQRSCATRAWRFIAAPWNMRPAAGSLLRTRNLNLG